MINTRRSAFKRLYLEKKHCMNCSNKKPEQNKKGQERPLANALQSSCS